MSMSLQKNSSMNLTARTMYQYDHHTNIPWNITQYQPLKQYLDPLNIILQKKYSQQKKGEKNRLYLTKRGFYMDYQIKTAKSIPGPNNYKNQNFWDFQKYKNKSLKKKIDPKIIKNTFLDQIQIQQKNRKKPGIGTYHIIQTRQQIQATKKKLSQKKRSEGPKRYFYEDTQFMSNLVPGAGAHHPRLLKKKIKLDKTDRKFWSEKHKKQSQVLRKRRLGEPGSATYKPMPGDITLFEHILNSPKKSEIKNGFGTDQKFAYLRQLKVKDKIKQVRPSPATYNTYIDWPTKAEKANESKYKKNWFNRISHGYTQGVYH